MGCGGVESTWLCTGSEASNAPGRLFLYCSRCRADNPQSLWVAVPLAAVDHDPGSLLVALYEHGLLSSPPEVFVDVLDMPRSWADAIESADVRHRQ
jgi:hypothetical protein